MKIAYRTLLLVFLPALALLVWSAGTAIGKYWSFPAPSFPASQAGNRIQEGGSQGGIELARAGYDVVIRKPAGPPRTLLGMADGHGNPVSVACSTCHSTRKPDADNRDSRDLDEFHFEMKFDHGNISCLSCHNGQDYDQLQLADGTALPFTEVLNLCAQCHGQQMRDFSHGVHGGMQGFWDLSLGPRTKNNCVDCHHPHAPQFPGMQPTFKPRDRFLKTPETGH